MNNLAFTLKRIRFDENYNPSKNTRATTNFANLARGEKRQENLHNALVMIDNRFNSLAHWDNPKGDRYSVELEIISAELNLRPGSNDESFPAIEILKTHIVDHKTGERFEGIVGNNFSSYVRDYDFSVLLSEHNKDKTGFSTPDNFGFLGAPPSHPALLDWLATEFVRSGWSIKHMHRLLVMSDAYRQSSLHPQHLAYEEQDASNRLLWRANRRRLDAERGRDVFG